MKCLRCGERQDVVVALDLRGVPHHTVDHNVIYDWSTILACSSCGYGELRVFSHDCWAPPWEEEWDMEWSTQLPPEPLALIRRGLAVCPDPTDTACACPTHVSLRETHTYARSLDSYNTDERPDARVALSGDGVPTFVMSGS